MLGEQRLIASLGAALDQAFVSNTVEVDFYDCRRTDTSIIRRMWETRNCTVWIGQVAGADRPFVRHCGNVAYLSMLMGMRLDFYLVREHRAFPRRAKDLTSLGVGGSSSTTSACCASSRRRREVQLHPRRLRPSVPIALRSRLRHGPRQARDPASAAVVLHHHQRHDGTGFPCRESFVEEPRPARTARSTS